jgi:ribosome biogenesis GTPase
VTENNKGTIIKGIGGFYYVRDNEGRIHECKARGRFRNDNVTPLPGDRVLFSTSEGTYGFIEEVCERHNELCRPRVANIDQVAIVLSVHKPKADCLLCDKLIVQSKKADIIPLLVLNKCDTADDELINELRNEYKNVCDCVCVSAATGEGLEDLIKHLKGRSTCFAGQSAVGKSSILNSLFPGLLLETGGLSKKTDRGRHTTRHAELLVMDDISGMVVDTPGFSFLESANLQPEELCFYYDDMMPYVNNCRFTSCMHAHEPKCGVKEAVASGYISEGRYQRYLTILKELEEKRLREYD